MQTLFLGREQIAGYLTDLQSRLLALEDRKPTVWVPLGYSGAVLLNEVFAIAEERNNSLPTVVPCNCRRDPQTRKILMRWGEADALDVPAEQFAGKDVIVMDSAVHSGSTMGSAVRAIWEAGASGVCSYSLVLKASSAHVPNYWAVSIGDEDRAYLLLDSIPNNRFVRPITSADDDATKDGVSNALPDAIKGRLPYFTVRKLSHTDVSKEKFKVAPESLNRSTWADLYYQMRNSTGAGTYVLEASGKIVGYITLEFPEEKELSLEQVATDPAHQGKGYAAAMLRWAETLGRLRNCTHIRLWAVAHLEGWYGKHGFMRLPEAPLDLGDEKYVRMRKCLLPHTKCCAGVAPAGVAAEAPFLQKL